ncbi:hypothetical protein AVEN_158962-1 [Araneus ventricosus]|uniref:Uncharacterized protein n=1 Tax=Araneus ventricosus TaxID=182803 RepID=A0A4Y2B915_ARAVE|nr:hypothetical protein AVEN_158962-1 [Araneus ventricosus]
MAFPPVHTTIQSRAGGYPALWASLMSGPESFTISYRTLNSSKGVITCGELFNGTLEQGSQELKSDGVGHVRHVRRRRQRESWIKYISSITSSASSAQSWKKVKAANGIYKEFVFPILNIGTISHSLPFDMNNVIGQTFAEVSSRGFYRPVFLAKKQQVERLNLQFRTRRHIFYTTVNSRCLN